MSPRNSDVIHSFQMRFTLTSALCFGLMLLSAGCALTRTETKLAFAPTVENPLSAQRKAGLDVGEIADKRPVKDKAVLIHKINGHGQTTSGAYVTERPVAEVFKEGLLSTLKRNGFTGVEGAKYELRGSIEEFEFDAITGFWKATVKPKLTVRLELVDKATGQSAWRETYFGRDTLETAWGDADFVALMFSKSAEDVLRQLVGDRAFRSHFDGSGATTAQKDP